MCIRSVAYGLYQYRPRHWFSFRQALTHVCVVDVLTSSGIGVANSLYVVEFSPAFGAEVCGDPITVEVVRHRRRFVTLRLPDLEK